jgi:two-component system OmpR family sensor kinase
MKGRLFWTILAGFWLTLALSIAAVVLSFVLLRPSDDSRRGPGGVEGERARAVEVAWRYGGADAVNAVVSAWPASARARLMLDPAGHAPPALQPDRRRPPPSPLGPRWPVVLQLAAGLAFSAALATYLARPISRLRDGFHRLAQGDLDVRLAPEMGRRRDELAGLAADFDIMAERLQHLILSRDRLLHDVSHELRSPLARMSLAVALAQKSPDRSAEVLERIEAEGERLNAIVGDLLSIFRAEEHPSSGPVYIDVGALLSQVCEDATFEAHARSVSVALSGPSLTDPTEVGPVVAGDGELLRRALENVIRNAVRFSHSGGVVTVEQRLEGARLIVEIRDRGPGVSPELLTSMFDPFVKGPGKGSSVGLGLAIAKRAVDAHGGEIEALTGPGGGLVVRIALPVA